MESTFTDLTLENLPQEQICCIVRKNPHPGIEAKRAWLRDRLPEGHVFRKLGGNTCAFIEYAPLETAWVPILGDNYLYLYCLWVAGSPKGSGVGKALMESCIADARRLGKSGICMLGADKQKAWLSDQSFAWKYGFEVVDTTPSGYTLLALSFDGTQPRFTNNACTERIESMELTVYYDHQCPFIPQRIEVLQTYCAANAIPAQFIAVNSLAAAKALPCVFNNWAVFYGGTFRTVNQIDPAALEHIRKKG